MRVFISYAHTDIDKELAHYLAARLPQAGIDVWLDEESMHGGTRVQKAIEAGAAGCQHAVFLVSRSWLDRDWTNWELGLFEGRVPPATLVPIWRRNRKDLKLPPQLWQLTGLEWFEGERDRDARIWQLHCALTDREPGPVAGWSEQGRSLASGKPPRSSTSGIPTRPPSPPSVLRPSLPCDRDSQWTTIETLASSDSNELLLVPGSAGQAHDHFAERVERTLPADPPRHIARVDWGHRRRPASREEYRDALARALDSTSDGLELALGNRLAHQNLVLVHDCMRSRFLDDTVTAYYETWLPQWLKAAGAQQRMKCIQPIEWPRESFGARLLRWVSTADAKDGNARSDAEMMIARLEQAGSLLQAFRVDELGDIAKDDLRKFCKLKRLGAAQTTWLIERIDSRKPRTTNDLFEAIDDFYPELPEERSL